MMPPEIENPGADGRWKCDRCGNNAHAGRACNDWPELPGTDGALAMFTIHHCPVDFPGRWVVRRSFCLPGGELQSDVLPRLAADLEGARRLVPPGLYRQPRMDGDDAAIVEVWF